MPICKECQELGGKLNGVLNQSERIFVLTATASMMRAFEHSSTTQAVDKMIASSVFTKTILSFPPAAREPLLTGIRQSVGLGITIGNCPHQITEIVKLMEIVK